MTEFRLDKAIEVAERMMARRKVTFTDAQRQMLEEVYRRSQAYRQPNG